MWNKELSDVIEETLKYELRSINNFKENIEKQKKEQEQHH